MTEQAVSNGQVVDLKGQRINMTIEALVDESGFWNVVARSIIGVRSETSGWVERELSTRCMDTDVDMAMGLAMSNLMEQVAYANLQGDMETEVLERENEQS